MDVDTRELRVVVEHLLEVRDEPVGRRAVAVEAAAELVVDAAVLPSRRGTGARWPAAARRPSRRDGAAGTRSSSAAGTSARGPNRRSGHRTAARSRAWRRRARRRPAGRPRDPAACVVPRSSASTTWLPACSTPWRSWRHACATPSRTWRKLGMPWRGSSGKYVPPKNGLPSRREEHGSSASRPARSCACTAVM